MTNDTKYKIIAFDLDGTLVDDNKELLPSTLSSVMEIQRMGIKVVLATGRPTYGSKVLAQKLQLPEYGGYVISYNGGKITSCADGHILARHTIPLELIPQVKKIVDEERMVLLTYRRNEIITEQPDHPLVQTESWVNGGMPITGVEDLVADVTKEPFKMAVLGEAEEVRSIKAKLEQRFGGALNFFISHENFLEIAPYKVDKGSALDFLLRDLEIKHEELIAVGDNYNDLGMLEIAGLGVAMANASEAIKRTADYVTTSNTTNGIQRLINKFILYPEPVDRSVDVEALNALTRGTLMEALGIKCTLLEEGYVEATMPVDRRTRQPMGILHGGASLALAETLAGYGSTYLLKPDEIQVGMQVSGNHIKAAHEGDVVQAKARIIHRGKSTHVWNIDIYTEMGQLVATVRVVNSILRRR
ncbi:MAG: Cof-type HAD-IIB family hydrolase [Porphyromonas sp.]|nr:Cof-type HAD-IIB family hydrolase [Porphyromonas sp.]